MGLALTGNLSWLLSDSPSQYALKVNTASVLGVQGLIPTYHVSFTQINVVKVCASWK